VTRADPPILSRYAIPGPGRLAARGSYRTIGAAFMGGSVLFGALTAVAILQGKADAGFWYAEIAYAVLFLCGLTIFGFRQSLEVDGDGLRWTQTTPFRRRDERAPRQALERVRLSVYRLDSSDSTDLRYGVSLVLRADGLPADLRVFETRREGPARGAAEAIARSLALPMEDAIGDEVIVRHPDAVGTGPPGDAVGAPPERVELRTGTTGPDVWITGVLRPKAVALAVGAGGLMLLGAVAGAAVALGYVQTRLGALAIPMVLAAPGLAFVAWGLVGARARQRIQVTAAEVVRETRLAGICWRRRAVRRAAVEALRIQTLRGGAYGLAVVSDEITLVVGQALEPEGLGWLRGWLAARLAA
jgi:hypothetical protein